MNWAAAAILAVGAIMTLFVLPVLAVSLMNRLQLGWAGIVVSCVFVFIVMVALGAITIQLYLTEITLSP